MGVLTVSYAVVRVQKMTAAAIKGIEIHDRREKEISHTNPDIRHDFSDLNYDLCPARHENFYKAVKARIDSLKLPRAVRKDAVVMAQVLVTSDRDFFDQLEDQTVSENTDIAEEYGYIDENGDFIVPDEAMEKYKNYTYVFFQKAYAFLEERYGKENVISATVHMDEGTPHMHFNFVPVTPDGRLCAKDVLSKSTLTDQQTAFHEKVGKEYGLLRGEPKGSGKRREHLETAEFKDAVRAENAAKDRAKQAEIQADTMAQKAVTMAQKAAEAARKVSDMEVAANKAQQTQSRLAAENDRLRAEHTMLTAQIDDAKVNLAAVNQALAASEKKAVNAFGSVEAARQSIAKERQLVILGKFLEFPGVKKLWEQFCRVMRIDPVRMESVHGRHGNNRER